MLCAAPQVSLQLRGLQERLYRSVRARKNEFARALCVARRPQLVLAFLSLRSAQQVARAEHAMQQVAYHVSLLTSAWTPVVLEWRGLARVDGSLYALAHNSDGLKRLKQINGMCVDAAAAAAVAVALITE